MNMQTAAQQAAFIEAHRALKRRIVTQRHSDNAAAAQPALAANSERRKRSLQTCHRYAMTERPRKAAPNPGNGYVPELASRIEDDPNLTDGARRCARKIAELTYRAHRDNRALPVTVTYLAKALGRCRRTVQRYLRQLEGEGYVAVEVVASPRSRMCIGLVVRLLGPLFAAHHRQRWPGSRGKPGATPESLKQRYNHYYQPNGYRMSVEQWAMRCMDGVFRAFMKTDPLAGLPPVLPA
jgi:hypothetical protein